jgi:hypothetical protein
VAQLSSVLYAPFVLVALRFFPSYIVAFGMLLVSLIWSYKLRKEPIGAFLLPFFYGAGAMLALLVEDEMIFKSIPLFIAMAFCLFFLSPEGGKWLSAMAKRFGSLSEKERLYVYKCRHFWAGVAFVNVIIHAFILAKSPSLFWALYASVGWYGVFLIGGVLQFLHQRFVFGKEELDAV